MEARCLKRWKSFWKLLHPLSVLNFRDARHFHVRDWILDEDFPVDDAQLLARLQRQNLGFAMEGVCHAQIEDQATIEA